MAFFFLAEMLAAVIISGVLLFSRLGESPASRLSVIGLCSALGAWALAAFSLHVWARLDGYHGDVQDAAAMIVFTLSSTALATGAGSLRRSRRRLLALGAVLLGPPGWVAAFIMVLEGRVH